MSSLNGRGPSKFSTDAVLFSNFRSPEYIMALQGERIVSAEYRPKGMERTCGWSLCPAPIWSGSPGFCPWHPGNPCHGTSSAGCHQRRNIHQGLHWWQPAESPSSLEKIRVGNEWKLSKRLETNLITYGLCSQT
uniref:Uncharacterized protein n=1 Tax=Sparus aurata TaxID=8175 RepID=A0A671YWV2_SPAAU